MERSFENGFYKSDGDLHAEYDFDTMLSAGFQGYFQSGQGVMIRDPDRLDPQFFRSVNEFTWRVIAVGTGGMVVQIGFYVQPVPAGSPGVVHLKCLSNQGFNAL